MDLLEQWEEQFKKGQLTLWVLLALLDGEKSADQIIEFIEQLSERTYTFEKQSVYRSLRNYQDMELVTFTAESNNRGPDRKLYQLTAKGKQLLKEFYPRNLKVFTSSKFNLLISQLNATD